MDKKIFEVEISSGGPESYKTSAVLTMPCTQAELCDALQKARVQDVKTCRNEMTRIRYPGITADMIGRNVDLLELNLLALRLTMLGEDDRMGLDGLLQIEKENHTAPFPLSRFINLTFNADTDRHERSQNDFIRDFGTAPTAPLLGGTIRFCQH